MGEPVKKMIIDGSRASRPQADSGRPKLEAIPGGSADARSKRVPLEVMDDAETVRVEEAETAPTEQMFNKATAREDMSAAIDAMAEKAETAPTEKSSGRTVEVTPPPAVEQFDLGEQVKQAADAALQARIDAWIEAPAKAAAEAAAVADAASDKIMNEWFVAEGIMPRDPDAEVRQPWDEQPGNEPVWDEKPPENKELNKTLEVARTVLTRGWEALRTRVNRLFEDNDGNINDRRVFGTSAVLGVVGAFAMAGLLAHQMEGFQKNVESYLASQSNVPSMEAHPGE